MRRLIFAAAAVLGGCLTAEESFTEGRLETLCAGALPVCNVRAGCVLDGGNFARGTFPGAQRYVVRTDRPDQRLSVRLLLSDERYPGTELLVQIYGPGCGETEQAHLVDVDFFRRAGDDGILEFTLALPEEGDHLLELFSDMSAGWVLAVEVADR